jgi:uncharacterized protein involved in response to NO
MNSWRLLWSAPHRLAFFLGSVNLMLLATWWVMVHAGTRWTTGLPSVPPHSVHALLLSGGFMPLFIAGFVFTTLPRWLAIHPVSMGRLVPGICAMAVGWWGALVALMWPSPLTTAPAGGFTAAVGVVLLGWLSLAWHHGRAARRSKAPDQGHTWLILVAWLAGAGGLAMAMLEPWWPGQGCLQAGVMLILWACLAPIFLTALHRMIPYLSMWPWSWPARQHPHALLWLVLPALAMHAGQRVMAALSVEPWRAWQMLHTGSTLVAGLTLVGMACRWRRVQNLQQRMLSMLCLGCFWMGLALWLSLAQDGRPAHHAMALGAMGSLMLAMVTRVSCTHGGQPVVADQWVWWSFLSLQLVVVLRLAAGWMSALLATPLMQIALMAWSLIMIGWAWRLMGWSLRARHPAR